MSDALLEHEEHENRRLRAENEKLRAALKDARECVLAWSGYANEYFREKHDLAGDLARIDAALSPAVREGITIPGKALEAAYDARRNGCTLEDICLAMLKAWPGVRLEYHIPIAGRWTPAIIIPLQEPKS